MARAPADADLPDAPHPPPAGGHSGATGGAEVDGVAVAELPDGAVRQGLAGLQVVFCSVGIGIEAQGDAAGLGGCLQDLAAFPDDLRADAVTLQQGDLIVFHCVPPSKMFFHNKK